MDAVERLRQIDHIVVVMMENRSFDHMLGYLSLPAADGGKARADIDGLTGTETNTYRGEPFEVTPMGTAGLTKIQDPGHSGADVGQQMAHGMSGFVANYMTTRPYQDGHDVMRYETAVNVPVYDFFADQFAVCDRWFCSVPGSTWPNRLAALTGAAKSTDNHFPPLYDRESFVRVLERKNVSWRWYSSDPGSLRLLDGRYRVSHQDHFAFVEKPSLAQPRTFYTDALKEDLPSVSWIDPNFVDLGGLQGASDDHPPTDVMAGQSFVLKIYEALRQSALWEKSMLVIVYDEHGGFYDHVDPTQNLPDAFTQRAEFHHFGPRIPALVVSPFVEAGGAFGSQQHNDPNLVFDHTALIRTILLRFADDDHGTLPERVGSSSHLGHLLTDGPARPAPEISQENLQHMTEWWARHVETRLRYPTATVPALQELGVIEGPVGAEKTALGVWALIGRAADWIRGLFGRRPAVQPTAAAPAPAVLTEASELERGVAAAALAIRRGPNGLPPGQP
jgi:phospholipase C